MSCYFMLDVFDGYVGLSIHKNNTSIFTWYESTGNYSYGGFGRGDMIFSVAAGDNLKVCIHSTSTTTQIQETRRSQFIVKYLSWTI